MSVDYRQLSTIGSNNSDGNSQCGRLKDRHVVKDLKDLSMEIDSLNGSDPSESNYVLNALNYINDLNDSRFRQEVECKLKQITEKTSDKGCDTSWDELMCWPNTPPGTLASLPCFAELHGIRYDTSRKFFFITFFLFCSLDKNKLACTFST